MKVMLLLLALFSVYCQRQLWILNSCIPAFTSSYSKGRHHLASLGMQNPSPRVAPSPAAPVLLLCKEVQLRQVPEQGRDTVPEQGRDTKSAWAQALCWGVRAAKPCVQGGRQRQPQIKLLSLCLALGYRAGKQDQKLSGFRDLTQISLVVYP